MWNTAFGARLRRAALLSATMLSGLIAVEAHAQTTPAPAADDTVDAIVVTGYRKSLAQSTVAKRESTGFADAIFAEDIGKFPDSNIAESFNRIPGITITRDITGEGANVAIRGLGSNFTNVTLNGASIAVASSGVTDAQGTDRSVDLSFFPTDLFTKLTVNKSYSASLLEGGAAGNIDMRSARPFDRPGQSLTMNVQGVKADGAGVGGKGSLIASKTWDTFGVLFGISGQRLKTDTRGYETIGYTNPNLSAAQCGATSGCNPTGGGNWTIPGTVPVGAGGGLVAGTVIDRAFLLANNPGATIQQIDNGLLPRIGRPSASYGNRDRINLVGSLEWRPNDNVNFYVDGMYGYKKTDLVREDIMWIVRNGAVIPLNTKYDKADCSAGCTVTSGAYANSNFFLEFRPYLEKTELWGINPGGEWRINDTLKFEAQANYTKSNFHRESPTFGPVTALGVGTTVEYTANPTGIPTIKSSVDLNNPANFIWTGGRVNMQDEKRWYETKGARAALTWGDEALNLKVGANYDDISRTIRGYDNSQAWQNATCGNNPSIFLPSPNSQPGCQGLNQPGAAPAGYPTYPGYGTGFTAGQTGTLTYGGSLIPTAGLSGYLKPGPAGFVTVDWDKVKQATKYDQFHDNTPESGGSNTGASGGYINEKNSAAYTELNGVTQVLDSDLRFNVGVRYVRTKQTIGGRVSVADPRNAPASGALPDGARYPNITNFVYTENTYSKWLPAASIAYDVGERAVARAAVSETMTRPDPSAQLPGVSFGAPSADQATIGNSALEPYFSKNIDLGFEFYTGQEGVVAVNAFRKSITGFTQNQVTTQPFSFLAQYGITYDTLNDTQKTAVNSRGGPTQAQVQVQSQINVPNKLTINGLEFQWVQPLDFLTSRFGVEGLGVNANATIVDQTSNGPATALGVAKYTYNLTGYYEHNGISLRVSHVYRKGSQVSGLNQNGIAAAALFSDDYKQTDFSSTYDLGKIFGLNNAPQVTFNVTNLTNESLRSYFQYDNATFTYYKPGRTYVLGLRMSF
ncbi:TonB-dependent receptor [Caulobacter vibrioides]|uniref:TonB-dependent receptor n=2 Tax=Caulobacter vibrioides TaxID=155892 RepID=Q9A4J9_CAUVC|nr:TonB-dependent receptor [Caulobacter vibrioides]YP_002518296.1 TonB-dependent receptor [Caulobacter vibrioides NA1000]AAK24796.1 TonB-dependent receptor [Caulobacter vibrioides CB15]ACL96388.1 TonB-dependent receptor [Caulobacter vibrioides NA1000]ATC29665.1 TonB-dependent receptor [Caulobacter vibrioides]QXZ51186.1 TonB-dependent receptor [Caulobacter vibrioides]